MDTTTSPVKNAGATGDEAARQDAELEKTRSQMSGTVNAIEERLAPGHIREQVMEQFGDAKTSVEAQVKEEFRQVKAALKDELVAAKAATKEELRSAKQALSEALKEELQGAKKAVKDELTETKQALRDATIGKVEKMAQDTQRAVIEVRQTLFETIKANPVPAALAGIGLTWLFLNRRSGTGATSQGRYQGYDQGSDRSLGQGAGNATPMGTMQAKAGQLMHSAGEALEGAQAKAGEALGEAQAKAGEVLHDARDAVTGLAQNVGAQAQRVEQKVALAVQSGTQAVGQMARTAGAGAMQAEQRVEQVLRDNPVAVGVAAFAAGTALGFLIPITQRENALMGEARDRVLKSAQESAEGAMDKAKGIVETLAPSTGTAAFAPHARQ